MKRRGIIQRLLAVWMALSLLALTGCQSDQQAIYSKYTAPAEPSSAAGSGSPGENSVQGEGLPGESRPGGDLKKKDLSGELTISDIRQRSGTMTDGIVAAFQKEYPNVKITVDYAMTDETQSWSEVAPGYFQRMATQLMSGEGADIITYWDGMISAKDIAENGYALDLHPWMDKDEEFHREDYFSNLFDSLEYQGGLYQLPILFSSYAVVLNSHITDELGYTFQPWDEIDYQTVIDMYQKAKEKGLLAESFTMEFMDNMNPGDLFGEAVYPDFFEERKGTVHFDSSGFIQYLEITKGLPSQRKLADGAGMTGGGTVLQEYAQSNASQNTSLMFSTGFSMIDFPNLVEQVEGNTPPLLLTAKGGACPFVSSLQYMVSSSCKDPELAWEFLKFAIGPIENPGYFTILEGATDFTGGSIPVQRENFRAYAKLYAQVDEASRSDPEGWMNGFDPQTAHCPLDEKFLGQVEQAVGKFNSCAALPLKLSEEIRPVLIQYYDTGAITARECAKQLQEKAELFLGE